MAAMLRDASSTVVLLGLRTYSVHRYPVAWLNKFTGDLQRVCTWLLS